MPTVHDYAGCQVEVCVQCDSYTAGYTAGKGKAFFEIRAVPSSGHTQDCACRPCSSVRDAIRGMIGIDQGERNLDNRSRKLLERWQGAAAEEEAESI